MKITKKYRVEIDEYGTIRWYKFDTNERHRENGPAIVYPDGTKAWYLDDKCHRENGPAIEHSNGNKYWFLNGEELTEEEFNQRMNSCNKETKTMQEVIIHVVPEDRVPTPQSCPQCHQYSLNTDARTEEIWSGYCESCDQSVVIVVQWLADHFRSEGAKR